MINSISMNLKIKASTPVKDVVIAVKSELVVEPDICHLELIGQLRRKARTIF